MSLKEYNKKRNFEKTSEPKGEKNISNAKKFVIQYHQARAKHYDFRLEYNGVLLSWAIPKGLSTNPKVKRLAVMVEDHPTSYINFEGIIPKGNYGAGTVDIFDQGEYFPMDDFSRGLKKGHLKFLLNGEKYKGGWSLIKTKDNQWLMVKADDKFTSTDKVKKTALPFKTCSVQLSTPAQKIPKGKNWIFEIKYDGYRMLSFVEKGKVKIVSRGGIDYTKKFDNICSHLKDLEQESFVLDGEIVAFDENGRSDFGLLQDNLKSNKRELCYVVFDLLALNGEDIREKPLLARKEKLERLLFKADQSIIYSIHVDKGEECFDFAKQNNLEGIVAKKIDSKYSGKRNEDWLKIKCFFRQEFIIAGYTTSAKKELISSLLLGYYEDKKLIYVGKVGTGLSETTIKQLYKKFQKVIIKNSPFYNKTNEKNVSFIKPKFVAEIKFTELTKDKLLRQPSFIGLRNDKKPEDVIWELKNEK